MAIALDRLKAGIVSLVRSATARLAYASPRFARVVKATNAADGSTALDVAPEDPIFPTMGSIPLFHGVPGLKITLTAGTRVLVEFSEGDPSRPFCRSWAGGEDVAQVVLNADDIGLGGPAATAAAVALPVNAYFKLLATHTHPVSGTVAGPSPALAAPVDVSATNVRVL